MAGNDSGRTVAMAVGAHPDDIEFMMAGTLLRLGTAGAEIHMWSVANGSCGGASTGRRQLVDTRWRESRESAFVAGAEIHPPLVDDMAILYESALLARVAAVVREVKPDIILVPAPDDYMEDHVNTSRLLVSAAFARGMPNFDSDPPVEPWDGSVVLYHALPHGLRDGLRRLVRPGLYVDVALVLERKWAMLEKHDSQRGWLEASQGAGSYIRVMVEMCERVGAMSGRFRHAEGWRRHSHLGFAAEGEDPLSRLLAEGCWNDQEYEGSLG